MQHRRHPVHLAQAALTVLALAWGLAAAAWTGTGEGWRLAGEGRLRFLGLALYDARLWTGPQFAAAAFERHPFVLELAYLRDFRGADIAERSIAEMHRQEPIASGDAARWRNRLRDVLPDVREGDRIAGVHRPGGGVAFHLNGRPLGEIADARFATRFFAIWLSPATTEPGLRAALLQRAAP
jgi:hypothetical protein